MSGTFNDNIPTMRITPTPTQRVQPTPLDQARAQSPISSTLPSPDMIPANPIPDPATGMVSGRNPPPANEQTLVVSNIIARQEQSSNGLNPSGNMVGVGYGGGSGSSANQNRSDFIALAGSRGRVFKHVPNVLDQYANYTYHIRWSLTDDIAGSSVQTPEEFRSVTKTVIAESGVTAGFNIIDFEINNLCSPDHRVRSMLHTDFKMTVKEPYGFSLVDRIYSLSRIMGVKNHLTNSSFIEIWFTGYKEDGTTATQEMSRALYKLFRVNVTKLESDTKSEGTTYNISGIVDGMYANSDHIAVAPGGANIGPVSTVGEFFDQLAEVLNLQQRNLQYDFEKRVEYKFNVPTFMRNWRFSGNNTDSQRNASIDVKYSANSTNPTVSIAGGMDVSTILFFVVAMTDDGKKYVAGENRQPNQTSSIQAGRSQASISANGMANILAVHSRSQLIGFDYLTNDYIRQITYTFTEYPTSRAMIDQNNVRAASQPAQQADRSRTLSSSGRYNKSYDYIFTGTNLDVLKMDIKLEWFWQATIPTQLGENVYSNFSPGAQVDPNGVSSNILNRYRAARSRLSRAKARLASADATLSRSGLSVAERQAAEQDRASARVELAASQSEISVFGDRAQQFQVLWDNQSAGQQALRNIVVGDRALLNDPAVAADIQRRQAWIGMMQGLGKEMYLEDVKVENVYSQPLMISFRPNPGRISQTTTIGGDGSTERASAQHGVGNLPKNRSLVSAVLNDVMSTSYFASIELDIRGDPYWLGVGNIEENRLIGDGNNPIQYTTDSAWFYGGETGFFLTFRTGEPPNEDTGYVDFTNTSIAFTGLYNVTRVTSVFKNGSFTQTLRGVKDALLLPESGLSMPTTATSPNTAIPVAASGMVIGGV
jgi:hypothetical protein